MHRNVKSKKTNQNFNPGLTLIGFSGSGGRKNSLLLVGLRSSWYGLPGERGRNTRRQKTEIKPQGCGRDP